MLKCDVKRLSDLNVVARDLDGAYGVQISPDVGEGFKTTAIIQSCGLVKLTMLSLRVVGAKAFKA
jgi:hypothetical protein